MDPRPPRSSPLVLLWVLTFLLPTALPYLLPVALLVLLLSGGNAGLAVGACGLALVLMLVRSGPLTPGPPAAEQLTAQVQQAARQMGIRQIVDVQLVDGCGAVIDRRTRSAATLRIGLRAAQHLDDGELHAVVVHELRHLDQARSPLLLHGWRTVYAPRALRRQVQGRRGRYRWRLGATRRCSLLLERDADGAAGAVAGSEALGSAMATLEVQVALLAMRRFEVQDPLARDGRYVASLVELDETLADSAHQRARVVALLARPTPDGPWQTHPHWAERRDGRRRPAPWSGPPRQGRVPDAVAVDRLLSRPRAGALTPIAWADLTPQDFDVELDRLAAALRDVLGHDPLPRWSDALGDPGELTRLQHRVARRCLPRRGGPDVGGAYVLDRCVVAWCAQDVLLPAGWRWSSVTDGPGLLVSAQDARLDLDALVWQSGADGDGRPLLDALRRVATVSGVRPV